MNEISHDLRELCRLICLGCLAACVCLPVLRENTLHFSLSLFLSLLLLLLYLYLSFDASCCHFSGSRYHSIDTSLRTNHVHSPPFTHRRHTRDSRAKREAAGDRELPKSISIDFDRFQGHKLRRSSFRVIRIHANLSRYHLLFLLVSFFLSFFLSFGFAFNRGFKSRFQSIALVLSAKKMSFTCPCIIHRRRRYHRHQPPPPPPPPPTTTTVTTTTTTTPSYDRSNSPHSLLFFYYAPEYSPEYLPERRVEQVK